MSEIVYCLAAKAVIVDSLGRVLLLREAASYPEGTQAGRWMLPGGRMNDTEALADALVREVREETGLTVEPGEEVHTGRWSPVIGGVPHYIAGVFFSCTVPDGVIVRLSGEHDAYIWASREMLDELDVVEPDRTAVLKVLRPGPHVYVSTACLHGLHKECRLTCKYCGDPCECSGCDHSELELTAAEETRLELGRVRHDLEHVTQERDAAQQVAAELKDILRAAWPVVAYVSTGRRFVDVEPYPDATARKVAWLIDETIGPMQS